MEALLQPARGSRTVLRSAADLLEAMRQTRETAVFRWDASGLDRVLRFDASRALAEVQNSTPWRSLAASLGDIFPALHGLASAPDELPPTVGQAVAENAAGPDGRPFVAHVESIALVTPDGELRRVSRQAHRDLFALVIGGQGVIGAPYSVTLRMQSLADSAAHRSDIVALRPESDDCGSGEEVARLLAPIGYAAALADSVRQHLDEWHLSPSRLDAIPVHPESETYLRWCSSESMLLRVGLPRPKTVAARVRLEQVHRGLLDCALALGGSFPIATTRAASREQVEQAYPMLRAFLAEKRRQDPRDCLENPWYRHHRSLLRRAACEVRWRSDAAQAA